MSSGTLFGHTLSLLYFIDFISSLFNSILSSTSFLILRSSSSNFLFPFCINALSNKTINTNMSGIDDETLELDYIIKIGNLFLESEEYRDTYYH